MSAAFDELYGSELSFLRVLGREYAESNPGLMRAFGDGVPDPDVERLLEGFAFLAARIRQRTEAEVPAFARTMIDAVFPERPSALPAATMVQFAPKQALKGGKLRLPSGTEIGSRPVDGQSCVFQTTRDLHVMPVQLSELTRSRAVNGESLTLKLKQPAGPHCLGEGRLRVFLSAPLGGAATLLSWFASSLSEVRYSDALGSLTLPITGVIPAFSNTKFARSMGQWAPPGYHSLSRLLVHPQEMLTFDLDFREALSGRDMEEYSLSFAFEDPAPLGFELAKEHFVFNCTEVVNEFAISAEPVALDAHDSSRAERILRAGGGHRSHFEVLSLSRVIAVEKRRAQKREVPRFPHYNSGANPDGQSLHYSLRWFSSPVDGASEVGIRLVGPEANADSRVLSVDARCSNRDLPTRLGIGDVTVPTSRTPSFVRFENVTGLSRPHRLRVDAESWRSFASVLGLFRAPPERRSCS